MGDRGGGVDETPRLPDSPLTELHVPALPPDVQRWRTRARWLSGALFTLYGLGLGAAVTYVMLMMAQIGLPAGLDVEMVLFAAVFPAPLLVLLGDGPMRQFIQGQVREWDLHQAVLLTGHREDIPEILRSLDCLVIASTRHEGVPQVGLQALATHTPVVGSDAGGIPEIIRSGETGRIFTARNAPALAAAIQAAFRDPEKTQRMAERGRRLVERHYGLDQMIDTLESLYSRCRPK